MRNFAPTSLSFDTDSILITGGTGSFGKLFARTLLERYNPRRVIIYSRDELKQYEMQQEFAKYDYSSLRFLIGDVRDRDRLMLAMREVDYVVHAAALKQIPAAEYNPMECIRTNVNGAENVVRCALECNVKKVIALSTDKAANPINLYGASKLASDKIFVSANNLAGSIRTKFSVVRYGNVVGSRGSVVPLFLRLLSEGSNYLPITDPRMTRFWITIQQGVDFVLSTFERMRGGEIAVPRIPSMRITDLAQAIAPHLEQRIIGIRPGEKLHEVMVTEDDSRKTLRYNDRYIIEPEYCYWDREENTTYQGSPVEDGFKYTSDNNNEWLDENKLKLCLG